MVEEAPRDASFVNPSRPQISFCGKATFVFVRGMIAYRGETNMRDRQLVESTAFGPTTLSEITTAFDTAWSEIAHHFGSDADVARARLAQAVLLVASDHTWHDIDDLKTEALQVLALTYRSRWPLAWH